MLVQTVSPKTIFIVLITSVVLLCTTNIYSLWHLGNVMEETLQVLHSALPSVYHSSDMNTTISDYRIREWRHVAAQTRGQMRQERAAMQEELTRTTLHLQELRLYLVSAEEQMLLEEIEEMHQRYLALADTVVNLSERGDKQRALQLMFGETKHIYDDIGERLGSLVALTTNNARRRAEYHHKNFVILRYLLGAIVMSISLFSFTLLVVYLRNQIRPRFEHAK
jgi:methyl-accepting chemotaxis protein